jgi:hypothetical protein
MDFLDLIAEFVFGFTIIIIADFILSLLSPIILLPFKLFLSEENYVYLCKSLTWLIYSIVITRYMDYTMDVFPNATLISRVLLFIVIGSFMYFFYGDKLNTAASKGFEGHELIIQGNLFAIEIVFVILIIGYLFLSTVFGISTSFINLDYLFKLIPSIQIIKWIVLILFLWIYVRYFFALLLAGFFTISGIRNSILGRFRNN